MQNFTIRELRERSGDLSGEAALAVNLFKNGDLTTSRAAKLARMSLPQFLAHLSAQGIAVVDHDPSELAQELAAFDGAK